ncbi:MAG: GNAT family N-acetyltransferase [Oscillospiraceae bacterium]
MPIEGIKRPGIIEIDDTLRLRKYDGKYDFAYEWYQDIETVYLVDGVKEPYSFEQLGRMYGYLNEHGELYFIEAAENGDYRPIGDVTFWQGDMPIVIGDKNYRGKHIGRKVVAALVERGRELGYKKLYVGEIYDYNAGSRKCFESMGFKAYEKTEKGNRFVLDIEK